MPQLYEKCIFAIRRGNDLASAFARGGGTFSENKPWTSAKAFVDDATAQGQSVPIVFADAATDTNKLLFWALLRDVRVRGRETTYVFDTMRRLGPDLTQRHLKISSPSIRGYVLCDTPHLLAPTYLLTWNPSKGHPRHFGREAKQCQEGKQPRWPWRCRNSHVRRGDRVFLMQQGRKTRGVFAVGHATGPAKDGVVEVALEHVIDTREHPPLSVSGLPTRVWSTQSSGVEVRAEAVKPLELAWAAHLQTLSPEVADEVGALEGEARERMITHRQREVWLRRKKLEVTKRKFGHLRCQTPGCGFDFAQKYGALGEDFAIVHHLKSLASREEPSKTKLSDLAVVCANCHAMIHRGGQTRSLDGLIRAK